jgi:tetratricopeptide (TPR) repeat protein
VPLQSGQFAPAQKEIAEVLRDQGRYREAVELLARSIASVAEPEASDVLHDQLAKVHERAGDRKKAIELLEAALVKRPQSETLTLSLAAALEHSGAWERAIETVRPLIKRDPDSAQALNFVGFVLANHDVKLDEARKLLERAFALRPGDGGVVDSLGWLYFKLGRLEDAEKLLMRADRLTPEDPEIVAHLAELYLRRADRGRALEAYRRVLLVNPEDRLRRDVEEKILLLETGRLGSR